MTNTLHISDFGKSRRASPRKLGWGGQAVIEFALIAPLIILLIMGVFDLGLAFFTSITLQNAAREGARYATLHVIAADEQAQFLMDRINAELIAGEVHLGDEALICPDSQAAPFTCQTEDGLTSATYECGDYLDITNSLQCSSGSAVQVSIVREYHSLFDFALPVSFDLRARASFRMP